MQGQVPDSATTSPTTRAAVSCEDQLAVALQRLDKTLDAYEKATNALTSAVALNAEHVTLENLLREQRDALRDLVKDLQADNDFLRKQVHPSKGALRKFFERVEKILILAAGVYIGKGL